MPINHAFDPDNFFPVDEQPDTGFHHFGSEADWYLLPAAARHSRIIARGAINSYLIERARPLDGLHVYRGHHRDDTGQHQAHRAA
jgi:hypothetical protein